jgi:hypothetical protein
MKQAIDNERDAVAIPRWDAVAVPERDAVAIPADGDPYRAVTAAAVTARRTAAKIGVSTGSDFVWTT